MGALKYRFLVKIPDEKSSRVKLGKPVPHSCHFAVIECGVYKIERNKWNLLKTIFSDRKFVSKIETTVLEIQNGSLRF